MGDVLRVGRHRPEGELRDRLEEPVQPDWPGVGNELEQVAHQQHREASRDLWVARPRFNRQVGDVLGRSAENRRHAGFVEMAAVAEDMRGGLDGDVGAPLERADRKSSVLVHGGGGEGRHRLVECRAQVGVEEADRELGDLGVAAVDCRQADVACGDSDRVNRFLSMGRCEADHVYEAREHCVLDPGMGTVDLGDDLVRIAW